MGRPYSRKHFPNFYNKNIFQFFPNEHSNYLHEKRFLHVIRFSFHNRIYEMFLEKMNSLLTIKIDGEKIDLRTIVLHLKEWWNFVDGMVVLDVDFEGRPLFLFGL